VNFRIEDLSNAENEIVKKAHENYGAVFDNANDLVSLTWEFPSEVDPEAWIFISFLSQVQKSLSLALLSAIRKHDVQTGMMLRYALESAVLACYALCNPHMDKFVRIDSDGVAQPKEEVLKKDAYKWIEKKYKTYSDKIKYMKGVINKSLAHANIILTTSNFDFLEPEMKVSIFDKDDELITKQRLWWIANISFGLLDLFSKVIHDFPLVKLADDFATRMKESYAENNRIKQETNEKSQVFKIVVIFQCSV
jgi:hypothetical protein